MIFCNRCDGSGKIRALKNNTIYTYCFKCSCQVGMSLRFNWPIWGQRAEVEFTNIKDDIHELARLIELWRCDREVPLPPGAENLPQEPLTENKQKDLF